jgi:plastocyanin
MRNKKIIIIIAVLILVGVGVLSVLFFQNSRVTMTVVMSTDSYTPSTFTVKKGSRVVFRNASEVPRWPASDYHPTHGIYPEFDPQEEIAPGEEWAFVFEKPGKWKMHDHLEPKIKGVVTVTE